MDNKRPTVHMPNQSGNRSAAPPPGGVFQQPTNQARSPSSPNSPPGGRPSVPATGIRATHTQGKPSE
ncbi:hypothetical protein D9613_012569 [Agrocybe pediades]|uniref:Uncharacterized protein n=1 Tax=Agrocybe pediades TaxID=84607 RepID=A0A8H4R3P3_9AGAR|nr:hypothetical protein D9613_012569 [Agrocybe pediades]